MAALLRAAKTLNESLDPTRVLARICGEAAGIFGGDMAAVLLGDEREGLRVESVYGLAPELLGRRMAPGEGLAALAEVGTAVTVPLRWDGETRGALGVGYASRRRVTPDEQSLLEALAEIAAAACRNAQAHAGLAELARTDGLTGCLNHAAMHESLRREVSRCERTSDALGMVLLDLDGFKAVNDEHGHLVGDEVLRRVGHALRAGMRPYDSVARYGGDEFAVVASGADEAAAGEIAARALDAVRTAVSELGEGSGEIAATAGVAEWQQGQTATELIGQADRALLYGKHRGARGHVVSASSLPAGFRPGRFERRTP